MTAKKGAQKSAKSTAMTGKKFKAFTDEERAAMKELAEERKAAAARWQGGWGKRSAREDRRDAGTGSRHGRAAPRDHQSQRTALSPRTWYGMPAYAKDGNVVCFFQSAQKFKTRYATFGFSDKANLDEGAMWPTAFALKELTAAEEARIGALVKKAVS